jgi:hypothetical protein
MPVQRRARGQDRRIIPPMTLANMRENGVRSILATCETCQHEAVLDADQWPAEMPVPDIGLSSGARLAAGGRSRPGRTGAAARGARSSTDRASAFEAEGCRFETCRAHHAPA